MEVKRKMGQDKENNNIAEEDIFLHISTFTGEHRCIHEQGRKLLYEMILTYYGVDLSKEENPIAFLKYGKPYLKNHEDLHFNISHSAQCVVCATGRSQLGVDVQIRKHVNYLKMGKKILSGEEWEILNGKADPGESFYHFWTKKESYVKYTGQGIRMDLTSLDYDGARFLEFSPKEGYSGMICVPENWKGTLQIKEIQE